MYVAVRITLPVLIKMVLLSQFTLDSLLARVHAAELEWATAQTRRAANKHCNLNMYNTQPTNQGGDLSYAKLTCTKHSNVWGYTRREFLYSLQRIWPLSPSGADSGARAVPPAVYGYKQLDFVGHVSTCDNHRVVYAHGLLHTHVC